LAKASDQFQARDVSFWGVFALAVWGVAVLGANLSALIPDSVLGGLHASRLGGATMNQLRGEIASLTTQAALLKQENTVLVQRFMVNEQASGEMTRRVGSLEQTVPKILESLNNGSGVDQSAVTASTGTTAKSFDADGGSVSYTTAPMPGTPSAPAAAKAQPMHKAQPMPKALADVTPDSASFGIALGPPIDADEAAAAWGGMTGKVGTLLIGLGPILGHVEGGTGRRLVAGPISSEADAQELCGRMAKAGVACQTVPFIGDTMTSAN
jgi:hypothetical protein